MKIVIIHYRYYVGGGPERYLFNISKLLTKYGHEVIPFSMDFNKNEKNIYDKYFAKSLTRSREFNLHKIKKLGLKEKISIILSIFFNHNAYKRLNELFKDSKPDIVYCLQYWAKLSPSIFTACRDNNIPVVLRISDFNLICAKNIFYRDGSVCIKCTKSRHYSIVHKCVHDSYLQSLINYLAFHFSFKTMVINNINKIIAPSAFQKSKFIDARDFTERNIIHIPTFVEKTDLINKNEIKLQTKITITKLIYFGRVEQDKGIEILIKAILKLQHQNINVSLDVIGNTDNHYAERLIDFVRNHELNNIRFLGFKSKKKILEIISQYSFSVIPSICFDNMPNSFIESQGQGIPVLASRNGSFTELIQEGFNGYLFNPGSENDLAKSILKIENLTNKDYINLRINSRNWVEDYCSEQLHYKRLIKVFKESTC